MKIDEVSSPVEYAFWQDGSAGFRVQYSLPVFHEIDFQVNEGYRRIPHGGIEIGGILWGRKAEGGVLIEAFRQIECEHASGPSFNLSERDIEGISNLLARAQSDDELRTVEPLGWFIAHTRSPLQLTDRELEYFDRFFPGPGKLTLLIKPERFQPTRFGFLVRGQDGQLGRDAASAAFILPLPGRAGKDVSRSGTEMIASIPAPNPKGGAVAGSSSPAASPPLPATSVRAEPPIAAPSSTETRAPAASAAKEIAAKSEPVESPAPRSQPLAKPAVRAPEAPLTKAATPTPTKPREQFRGMPTAAPKPEAQLPGVPPAARPAASASTFRLFLLLLLAAGLGCAVGYFAYLQLPSPYIAVQAEKRQGTLYVQWPAGQTRGIEYAAVRVDDGPPQLLSDQEKENGHMEVKPRSENTKVEIIAQHWIRDSRGIVRYLGASGTQ